MPNRHDKFYNMIMPFMVMCLGAGILPAQVTCWSVRHTPSAVQRVMLPQTVSPAAIALQQISELKRKEDNCLVAGRVIGLTTGSTLGLLGMYWNAVDQTQVNPPMWKNLAWGVPVCAVGSFVGYHTGEWTTRRLLAAKPKPVMAALQGAGYGALQGAATLSTSFIAAFVLGHYMGTVKFNEENITVFKLIGMSMLGGCAFGGMIGAAGGTVYGPGVSLYMTF